MVLLAIYIVKGQSAQLPTFTDEGGEYTRLVVWVYTNNMTKNIDIAKKIEKDFPASNFTKKRCGFQ